MQVHSNTFLYFFLTRDRNKHAEKLLVLYICITYIIISIYFVLMSQIIISWFTGLYLILLLWCSALWPHYHLGCALFSNNSTAHGQFLLT